MPSEHTTYVALGMGKVNGDYYNIVDDVDRYYDSQVSLM